MLAVRRIIWIVIAFTLTCCAFMAAPALAAKVGSTIPQPTSGENDSQILITEFMADNESTVLDEDGDTSDWIEIKNVGAVALNLAGYALTDSLTEPLKWIFPGYTLEPGAHLLVFASGKDRTDHGGELHTNFSLQRGGEFLALVSPDGLILDDFGTRYPPQYADIAYGIDGVGTRRYLPLATPGTSNDISANNGPHIVGLAQYPTYVYPGGELRVVTVVRPGKHQIFSVELRYRVMYGPETIMSMGLEGTDNAGNLIYSAIIPASEYSAGEMVRYYTTAFDVESLYTRWPLVGNPDDSPYYFGTVIADPTIPTGVPTLHWFVKDEAAAETRDGTRGSVFFEGRLYDNVFVRTRGVTAQTRPKKSFKFDFNDGYEFNISALNRTVDEINVNSNIFDTSYIRQILAWEAFRDAGSPYSFAFPLRVQRNGDFYGLFTLVEQPDGDYFDRNELDYEGALYKVDANGLGGGTQGLEKRTREDEDMSDILALISGIHLDEPAREAFLFDNINLPAVVNFLAVSHVTQDWDFVAHNHYLYRDTRDTGEWMFLPWDKDLTFGPVIDDGTNSHPFHGSREHPAVFLDSGQTGFNHLIEALYATPRIREMYLRRLRTLSDLLLQPPGTPQSERYFEGRIDQLSAQLADVAALDAQHWYVTEDFPTAISWIKTQSLDAKRRQLYQTLDVTAGGIFPAAQPSRPQIFFRNIDASVDGQEPRSEYFVLHNHGTDAIDISGWQVSGAVEYTFQPGTVIPADNSLYVAKDARAFRNRTISPRGGEKLFVQEGYKGMLPDDGGTLWLQNLEENVVDTATFGANAINAREVYLPLVRR